MFMTSILPLLFDPIRGIDISINLVNIITAGFLLTTFIYMIVNCGTITSKRIIDTNCTTANAKYNNNNNNNNGKHTQSTNRRDRNSSVVCPFSQESNFMIENAEHLPLSPLEMYEDWMEDYNSNSSSNECDDQGTMTTHSIKPKPLAARWLNMGISGQDVPGILRVGLRRLRNEKYFLLEEPHRMRHELLLKKAAYDNAELYPEIFVALPESLLAQQECLHLFLNYLPRRYPREYVYDKDRNTIHVNCIDTTFHIDEYYHTRPLELCVRIVQEDLVLMRPPTQEEGTACTDESYTMGAAAILFSSDQQPRKLGKPLEYIHAPVPGYETHIRKAMNFTFSRLKVDQPMWRTNWGIAPTNGLDDQLYGFEVRTNKPIIPMSVDNVTEYNICDKFLKVEYQTLRRLPISSYILFSVNTMVDPMYTLQQVPMAAACLAKSIRGMSPSMLRYKGIDNDTVCQAVLTYLDSIAVESE